MHKKDEWAITAQKHVCKNLANIMLREKARLSSKKKKQAKLIHDI